MEKLPEKPKHAGGRPTKMTPDVQDEILNRIVAGESVVKILRSSDKFPDYSNFTRFLNADGNEEFRTKYVRAKEDQADYLAEEILDIADDGTNDWMERHDKGNVGWAFNGENYQRSRLRVDARKWVASKMKPKKYGESLNQNVTATIEQKVISVDAGPNPYPKAE
jgi:hypothetical protein